MRTAVVVGGGLLLLLAQSISVVVAQEIVSVPARPLPTSDADVELQFAKGDLPTAKASEWCSKLKSKPAKINSFGCEKAASLKEAKKIWEQNAESSDWEALSMIDEAKFGQEASKSLVDTIMEDALGSVKIESGKMSFGKTAPAETTGRLMFACGQLTDCLKRTLTPEERVGVAQYLLSVDPVTIAVALGLKALSDFGMASVTSTQHSKDDSTATVVVTSLVGKPLKWKLGKATSPMVSMSGKPNEIKVKFDEKSGKVAKVPVQVELDSGQNHLFNLEYEVTTVFSGAKLLVKEKSTIRSEITIGSHPAKLEKAVSLEPNQVLEISLSATSGNAPFCPEQAVFGLVSSADSGLEFQVPSLCTDKEIRVTITNSAKFAEELRFQSGNYELIFIASDEKMSNPTIWKMGSVVLALSPPPEKKHESLFTHALLHESDSTLKLLPEIHHQFRQPDRRAPYLLSFVFSCANAGYLVALIVGLISQGFNPLNIFNSFRLIFFTLALTVTEILFFWYWIGPSGAPNMESLTYKYLPPLLIVLVFASKNAFGRSVSKKKNASM